MKRAMRWMVAGLLGMPLVGCLYYPDYGYVRGDGYGSTGGVYYDTASYDSGYYGGYYSGGYYGGGYGGYGGYYQPYGYSPYYGSGYYSIGIGLYDGHRGHGWHGGGHGGNHHRDRGHDARPSHRAGPEVQSRRRR